MQRIGYDSFTPDNGVLIAKNKDEENSSCGYNCFTWVIDAHPEDSNMVDFKRPDGTVVMRTIADYRQLNDALFHAGSASGSSCEWLDAANRLHFYVIDSKRDAFGILAYTVGVRSLDGSGPQQRGVALKAPPGPPPVVFPAEIGFVLTNTGEPAAVKPDFAAGASSCLDFDVYRLEATVDAPGWTAALANQLAAVKFGDSRNVFLRVSRVPGSAAAARVTLTARSESDPTQSAQVQVIIQEVPE